MRTKNLIFLILNQTCAVGTQKNLANKTFLWSTQNIVQVILSTHNIC